MKNSPPNHLRRAILPMRSVGRAILPMRSVGRAILPMGRTYSSSVIHNLCFHIFIQVTMSRKSRAFGHLNSIQQALVWVGRRSLRLTHFESGGLFFPWGQLGGLFFPWGQLGGLFFPWRSGRAILPMILNIWQMHEKKWKKSFDVLTFHPLQKFAIVIQTR